MKISKAIIVVGFTLLTDLLAAQQPESIPIERLAHAVTSEPRPIVIKLYTSWCSYCKLQDRELEKHADLNQRLTTDFHYVNMDAETREDLLFNGKSYRYVSGGLSGGTHELAYMLGSYRGLLTYPAWVLLDNEYRVLARHHGFLNRQELHGFLTKAGE